MTEVYVLIHFYEDSMIGIDFEIIAVYSDEQLAISKIKELCKIYDYHEESHFSIEKRKFFS